MAHPLLPGLLARVLTPELRDGLRVDCERGHAEYIATAGGWDTFDARGDYLGVLSTSEARAAIGKIVRVVEPDTRGLAGATVIRGVGP